MMSGLKSANTKSQGFLSVHPLLSRNYGLSMEKIGISIDKYFLGLCLLILTLQFFLTWR